MPDPRLLRQFTPVFYATPEYRNTPGRLVKCPQVAWLNTNIGRDMARQYGYETLTITNGGGATTDQFTLVRDNGLGFGDRGYWPPDPDLPGALRMWPSYSPDVEEPGVVYPMGFGRFIRADVCSVDGAYVLDTKYGKPWRDACAEAKAIIEAARPGRTFVRLSSLGTSGTQDTSSRHFAPTPDAGNRKWLGTDFLYVCAGWADYAQVGVLKGETQGHGHFFGPIPTYLQQIRDCLPVPDRRSLPPAGRFRGYTIRYFGMDDILPELLLRRTAPFTEPLNQGWWPWATQNSDILDTLDRSTQYPFTAAADWAGMLRDVGVDAEEAGSVSGVTGEQIARVIADHFSFTL